MYEVMTRMTEPTPTYRTRRMPTAVSRGGASISSAGAMGSTLSAANAGSVGGVTKGSAKRAGRLAVPMSAPSAMDMIANPNMMLVKNAPSSSTLVICQTAYETGGRR